MSFSGIVAQYSVKFSKLVSHSGAFYSLTPDGIRADYARATHKNLPVVVPAGMRNRYDINLLTHTPKRSRGNLDNFRQWAALSKSSLSDEHLEPFPCKKSFSTTKIKRGFQFHPISLLYINCYNKSRNRRAMQGSDKFTKFLFVKTNA